MKKLIIIVCLVFLIMIVIANIKNITGFIIEQYNTITQDAQDDINKAFNSLL